MVQVSKLAGLHVHLRIRKSKRSKHPYPWLLELNIKNVVNKRILLRAGSWTKLIADMCQKGFL